MAWQALWPVIAWWRGKGGKGGGGAEPTGDDIFKLMAEWIESISLPKGEEKEMEMEGGGEGGKSGGGHAGRTVARILLREYSSTSIYATRAPFYEVHPRQRPVYSYPIFSPLVFFSLPLNRLSPLLRVKQKQIGHHAESTHQRAC